MTNVITAAGGLVWRPGSDTQLLAVIHRPRYDDWTLPKGKVNAGEDWEAAAIREVWEETGCQVRLGSFVGCVSYQVKSKPKVVLFWNMHLIGECEFTTSEEVDAITWLSIPKALQRLDHATERELLQKLTSSPGSIAS